MSDFEALIGRLIAAGARVERGAPAADSDVAHLVARLGPVEHGYEAFLRAVGALRITTALPGFFGDVRVFGVGGGPALDALRAFDAMRDPEAWWGQPIEHVAPVIGYGVRASVDDPFGGEGYVLFAGRLHHLHRGVLDPRVAFVAQLDAMVDDMIHALAARDARRALELALLDELAALLAPYVVARGESALTLRGGAALGPIVVRVEDGGDDPDPCVRVAWDEPGLDPAALDARNRDARIARGRRAGALTAFRASARGAGFAQGRLAAAIAHDARLPARVEASRSADLEALERALAEHAPTTPEERLLAALVGAGPGRSTRGARFVRRSGALVGPSSRGLGAARAIEVSLALGPEGLLVVEHRREDIPEPAARAAADAINGTESGVLRAYYDGALCVRLTSTVEAVASERFAAELRDLERAVAGLSAD